LPPKWLLAAFNNKSVQSNQAKGRITDFSPMSILPLPVGISGSHLTHDSLDLHESFLKRHLEQISRFCTAHTCDPTKTDRHTNTNTDHAICNIRNNSSHLRTACRQCDL